MVAQLSTLPSSSSKFHLDVSAGEKAGSSTTTSSPSCFGLGSQPRCISLSTYLTPCQPVMEATKALAQKLRIKHRTSFRRKSNSKQADQTAVDDTRSKDRNSKTPAPVAIHDPLAATPPAASSLADKDSTTSLTDSTEVPPLPTPGSDVSPTSQPPPKQANGDTDPITIPIDTPNSDYFNLDTIKPVEDAIPAKITFSIPSKPDADENVEQDLDSPPDTAASSATPSTVVSQRDSVDDKFSNALDDRRSSMISITSRRSSTGSLAFRIPSGLRRSRTKSSSHSQRRESSPTLSTTFRKHVTFTNVHLGEPTKFNFPCYTLVVRHLGYQSKRRSRTFMVGIDDHQYSDEALQWLFDKFVDDGDEIVCVRVVEKDVRVFEADKRLDDFQREANAEVAKIQAKCGDKKAVSIVLEYAVGKLHLAFQRLIQLHQPSMLIVGTRGRTLGGFQGLVASRNSFSKYCLQYSPVPVVVVRPDEKRQKKKEKRDNDPEKQSYRQMLQSSHGVHEADSDTVSTWEVESNLSPDEEAGKVARALGLPAKFDPTLKPFKPERQRSTLSVTMSLTDDVEPGPLVADSGITPTASAMNSEDEAEVSGEEDDEGEAEFEVTSGAKLVQSQKKELEAQQMEAKKKERLHAMEVGEAAALLKNKPANLDEPDEEEDDDDEDDEDGGGAVKTSSAE